jgi:hypothetical protein
VIRMIDLAGYAGSMMALLMFLLTKEMLLRVLGMFGHVAVVILSILVCLLPVLSLHLMLLPVNALRLWEILTGSFARTESSQSANRPSGSDRCSLAQKLSLVGANFNKRLLNVGRLRIKTMKFLNIQIFRSFAGRRPRESILNSQPIAHPRADHPRSLKC